MTLLRSALHAALVTCCIGLWGSARAQEADAAFFRGKTIRLIIGYSPGGGYDFYARMIAPFVRKYLGANVIVENRPGAGGLTALNGLAMAVPDGLQIMLVKGNAATMAQVLKEPAVRYDMTTLSYLGGVGLSPDIWLVSPALPINSVAAAERYTGLIRWGASGPMDGLQDGAAITCEGLKLHCRVIMGYPGTNDIAIALARNETDAMLTNESTASAFVQSGSAQAVAAMAEQRSRFFPDLPTVLETPNLTPDQRWWFAFRAHIDVLGRMFIAPPNMPAGRLAVLREAFRKALTDPELIAQGEKSQRYISFQDPEQMHATAVGVISRVTDEEKDRVRVVIKSTE